MFKSCRYADPIAIGFISVSSMLSVHAIKILNQVQDDDRS